MMDFFRHRASIRGLLIVLCMVLSFVLPVGAADISGLDAVAVTNGTENASAGTITGSHSSSTSDTKSTSKTMTLTGDSASLGSAVGTLSFKVKYTMSAPNVWSGTDGKASISASSGVEESSVTATSGSGDANVTVENWKAGSTWTFTMTASSSKGILSSHQAATVNVTISEIAFEEYRQEGVTFIGVEQPYTVSYYADAETATLSTQTVPAGSTGTEITAALTRGLFITAEDYYYCTAVQADRSGTNIDLSMSKGIFLPQNGDKITPTFVQDWDKDGVAPFLVNGDNCWNWAHALAAVGSSGTIVQNEDYTFTESSCTIPSGVTLLLPYSASDTTIGSSTTTVDGKSNSTMKHANIKLICAANEGTDVVRNGLFLPNVDVTYTLTVPNGTTLNVDSGGRLVIGGTIAAGNRSTAGISCAPTGAHSNLQLEGTLNVSGVVSACGYILGGGQVNVNSGGAVYQPFTIMDFTNGPYTIRARDDGTWPFYRYAMTNIQSDMRMVKGATMLGYVDLYTAAINLLIINVDNRHNVTEFDLISSTGLVRLNDGATLDISYSPNIHANDTDTNHRDLGMYHRIGKTTMAFNGGTTFASTSVTIELQGTKYPLNTTGDHFVIPYNYDVVLNSGTFTVANKLKLLPGATMTVNSGATVQVPNGSSLAVMSGLRDHRVYAATSDTGSWYNEHYPSTAVLQAEPFKSNGAGNLIINGGTLQVDKGASFGGVVQTTGTGSVIMNGSNQTEVKVGVSNESSVLTGDLTGRSVYKLYAQVFTGSSGTTPVTMQSGQVFYAADAKEYTIKDYTYNVYTSSTSNTATELTQSLNSTVKGTWAQAVAKLKDTNGAYMKDTSGNEIFLPLVKALDAYQNSSGVSYIEMVDDSTDATSLSASSCIDLNGHNVSNVTVTAATEFMDLTTNGYTAAGGQLTVTSGAKNIAPVTEYTLGNTGTRYYVKVYDKTSGIYTFPRVAVSVTGMQYIIDGDSKYLVFQSQFRGPVNPVDMGFEVNGVTSWHNQTDGIIDVDFTDESKASYGISITGTDPIAVRALLGYGAYTDTYADIAQSKQISNILDLLKNVSSLKEAES